MPEGWAYPECAGMDEDIENAEEDAPASSEEEDD
jgi:hypothetical protein